ncbi:hypothetical protein, partial [[Eubacterium] cellulosolvens]
MKKIASISCIIMLILFSVFQLRLSISETGTVTRFSDSAAEKNITIPSGGGTDNSATIDIPKKATITDASFDISTYYTASDEYPNKPTIDVGNDGDYEWAFSGMGYGDFGQQNVFSDDNPVQSVFFNAGEEFNNDVAIRMPKNATVSYATMTVRGGGAGNVLLVTDNAESYGVNKIDDALTKLGNNVTVTIETKLPSGWSNPKNFKAIFWIGNTSSNNGPSNTLLGSFVKYVKGGGNVFMCGAWIDYTGSYSGTDEIPFFEWALHHTWGNRWSGGGSGIGTTNKYTHQSNTSHPVFNTPNTLPTYWNNLYTGTFWHSPSGTINNGSIIGKVDTTTTNPRYSAIIAWDGPEYDPSYGRTLMVRQPIASSWYNITQGDVLTNFTENVITWFLGMGKAENVTINIGDNGGTPEFDHSGQLDEALKVSDFSSELVSLISTLPVSFTDEYGIQFVDIPVNITNDVEGMVLLAELMINYNLTTQVFQNPHNSNLINELNELVPDTGDDNITILLSINAKSGGTVHIDNIIIDYFIPDLTNDRLLVINSHGAEKICYTDYENYQFMVNVSNHAGINEFNNVTLILDTEGEQLKLLWEQSTLSFTELYDPKNLIELDTLNCQSTPVSSEKWSLIFSIRFTWEYMNETPVRCALNTTNDTGGFIFNYFEAVYRVENDLDLIGTLEVHAADQGKLIEDGINNWVHASEKITWGNLTAVYEGTTNIYPDDKNFNVTITDDDTGSWVDSSSSGQPVSITTFSDPTSDYTDLHHITITDIPGVGGDVSNLSFMIKTDDDGPLAPPNIVCHADSEFDPETTADDDNLVYVVWSPASDSGGAGVKEYAMEFNDVQPTSIKTSGDSVIGSEGLATFYVRARDRVGNWGTTGSASIIIDLTEVTFSQPLPDPDVWQRSTVVECSVLIQDLGGSGVLGDSIQYRYVDSGSIDSSAWNSYGGSIDDTSILCKTNITFSREGIDKKVQWRAKDRAGNGFVYSDIYTLKIDSKAPVIEDFSIDFNKWYNTLSPVIDFKVNDSNPFCSVCSGIDLGSAVFSTSTSGITNYGPWQALSITGGGDIISCSIQSTFSEGDQNYIKIWTKDLAGNEIMSDDLQLQIDISDPKFERPMPGPAFWSNKTRVQCFITVLDPLSEVNIDTIRYSISTNG